MKKLYKLIVVLIILIIIGCTLTVMGSNSHSRGDGPSYNMTELDKLSINMNNWHYDETNDIYYQIGLVYCLSPEDKDYESCGIYVPGKYFEATKNSNETYTCKLRSNTKVGNYTAGEAPIVMPVNTPGYSSCKAPTSYNAEEIKQYTNAGFIYLNPGCRGRDNSGAPSGVTDLKAAVTYYRYNKDVLPGDTSRIFTFGHSGGGAQSAIMGTSGNSELYNPYLESIGAAMVDKDGNSISNTIMGSMCWCPITNLDTADAAYEWNMGQYIRNNTSFTGKLSNDLASEYALYINNLGLKDPDGNRLTLEESTSGIYANGSYYEYILNITEESLNNFLNDTTFPYTPSAQSVMGDMPSGGAPMGDVPSMGVPGGEAPMNSENMPAGNPPTGMGDEKSSGSESYETAQDYINFLNGNDSWIEYDAGTNTANITSLESFVKHCKNPSKSTPAFDDLNKSQAENGLFGIDGNDSAHFDKTVESLLARNAGEYSKYDGYSPDYVSSYGDDLEKRDSVNNSVQTRVNMYNPLFYLCDYYNASGSSEVAQYWRINTGIEQGDTSQCVDVNLYLAVLEKVGKDNVEFSTVWNQGHTQAERVGDSTTNFINWVNDCLK